MLYLLTSSYSSNNIKENLFYLKTLIVLNEFFIDFMVSIYYNKVLNISFWYMWAFSGFYTFLSLVKHTRLQETSS